MRVAPFALTLACAASLAAQEKHWAFVKPERPAVPASRSSWVRNPVDAFVLARLNREGLKPAPTADRRTLLRRVHLDLTGLPPTPDEVRAFLADRRPDAYERVVDRLLASPHYGERQARHWLDAARYADSNGFSIDSPRSVWPYRDWVIRAYNRDMPFDRFVVEQMAGDLLPNATRQQRVATGFHRHTMTNEEGGVDKEEFRIEAVKDRASTTATVFLGLTLTCAQCHDHKHDPLTQDDFYGFYAFLNDDDEPRLLLGTPAERAALADWRRRDRELGRQLQRARKAKDQATTRRLRKERSALRRRRPRVPSTLVLARREKPRTSHFHTKGDFTRKGKVMQPAVPAVLHDLPRTAGRPTRLDLARWLVSADNPLLARVTVNRMWQRLFGRGLVATENDFGTQGERPSHPQLLDWLATELARTGWRRKQIQRLMVTSSTYRQSSHVRPELRERDPHNRLLARQRRLRLDAEILRDSALVAAGVLERKVGGPSVYPPQPDGVMTLGQSRRAWRASRGANRFRRGLYTFFWRATPHPALMVFDAPTAMESCTRRVRSNTPLQALTLLNDPAFAELARRLAARIVKEVPAAEGDRARLRHAFQVSLGRPPRAGEVPVMQRLLDDDAGAPETRWLPVARVLLNLDEFMTRETP